MMSVNAQGFNFPETPTDYGQTPSGLDGRQASPLPSFPTLSVPVPTTVSVTPVASPLAIPVGGISTNIVTPAGQTCVCVPTGACTPGTTGTPGGEGLIDIRIVNNLTH
ncbi:hypothetical protein Bhyg_09626 [Pseudolycoriella hygida]|uniref:PPAF-2-like Clip domain-containing protein n=1 Tax=Pseudolycoriella hygida TaxID=35572 RepID=A0A9Q0N7L5_9DIPT|nr:hypothetical protein Bhyg_09626 [Pseudolycoriella hygida]